MSFEDFKAQCVYITSENQENVDLKSVCETFDKLIKLAIESGFPHRPISVTDELLGVDYKILMIDNTGEFGSFPAIGEYPWPEEVLETDDNGDR